MQTTKPGPTVVAGGHLEACSPQGWAGPCPLSRLLQPVHRQAPELPCPAQGVGGYLLPPSESWRSRVSLESL